MTRLLTIGLLAGTLALPLLALPGEADASCRSRKTTGTVIGGVGGAVIGNAISKGGGGLLVGGLGGAVIGHQVAKGGCHRARSTSYYRVSPRGQATTEARPKAVRYVYYDQFGNPVSSGPAPTTRVNVPIQTSYSGSAGCRTEMRSYYDDRGLLSQRPVQICAR